MHKERTPGIGTVGAIIVAAGSGVRMEGLDKLFTQIADRPLIAHAVAAFEECARLPGAWVPREPPSANHPLLGQRRLRQLHHRNRHRPHTSRRQ